MAGNRAALRVGLIGGLVLGLAVAAQQLTLLTDTILFEMGWFITISGLLIIGFLAARDTGNDERRPSMRAGAVAGLIAGLVASLAVVVVMMAMSFSSDNLQRIDEVLRQAYTPDQLKQLIDMGATMDMLAQTFVVVQIMCCGAGLPVVGVLLGTIGGSMASRARGSHNSDEAGSK